MRKLSMIIVAGIVIAVPMFVSVVSTDVTQMSVSAATKESKKVCIKYTVASQNGKTQNISKVYKTYKYSKSIEIKSKSKGAIHPLVGGYYYDVTVKYTVK